MPIEPPKLTASQLKVHEALEKIAMGWLALKVVLVFFGVTLAVFLFMVVNPKLSDAPKIATGFLNSLLVFPLHQVYRHLFPTTKQATRRTRTAKK